MDPKETLRDSRSLRSKGTEDTLDDSKFDFEQEEYSIDPNKKFLILHSRVKQNDLDASINKKQHLTNSTTDNNSNSNDTSKIHLESDIKSDQLDVQKSKGLITSMILEIKTNKIDDDNANHNNVSVNRDKINNNVAKTLIDPLSDETYASFHKKMLKQENRMHQFDVNQGISEAERLGLIYDKLDLPSWISTLQRVTVINDPTDEKELLKKKILTKQHIKSLLNKYNRMQKRNRLLQKYIKRIRTIPIQRTAKIYQNLDRTCDIDYHSSSDEEQDESIIDNTEICRRRLLRKETQCGGSIIIGISYTELHKSKFVIMAEPLKRPYIVKTSKEERQNWKNFTGLPRTLQGNVRTNNQIAEYKQKILIPLTLTTENANKNIDENSTTVESNDNYNKNNSQNIDDDQTNKVTEATNNNDIENKNVTEKMMSNENEDHNIQKNSSDQTIQLDDSYISSSEGSPSLLPSTCVIKTEQNSHEGIVIDDKKETPIITRSESYDIMRSRFCASEPCVNFFGKDTVNNNNNKDRGRYSAGEDIGNRRLTPTVPKYSHTNNRNIMSISNITNCTSYDENYWNGSNLYKNDNEKNSVNILTVRKKSKLNPIEGTINFSST